MRIDLHTHSNISDGTDTPTRLVLNAQRANLEVIGLCDHDTFEGLKPAMNAGTRIGIRVIPGVEISTKMSGTSVHLLGYGMSLNNLPLNEELAKIRKSRFNRLNQICTQLSAAGLPITEKEVLDHSAHSPSVGRPHVADVMVQKGYVKDRREAFDIWLEEGKPGYVTRYALDLPTAIDLVHQAGGVAIIAHPWGRSSRKVLNPDVLQELKNSHDLDGIEVDHTDHDDETRSLLFEMGARIGLIRTGSSDYHGVGKPDNPLGIFTTRPSAFREIERRVKLRGGNI